MKTLDPGRRMPDTLNMTVREKGWLAGLIILAVLALVELFHQ